MYFSLLYRTNVAKPNPLAGPGGEQSGAISNNLQLRLRTTSSERTAH